MTYVFPYKVREFGGKLGQKSSEAPISGSPLMIHRSDSYRPEEIMLFHFFKVFPNTDAFEFCFYILKAGLLY